jgi:RNA polymerase sigma-70 factor (ECF subfamily)
MRLIPRATRSDIPAARSPGSDPDLEDAVSASDGDTAAFERIYHRHALRLFGLANRFLGPDLAEDALQDVFVHAWERLAQFRGESLFATWLHRLAINVLIRQASTARRITQRLTTQDVAKLPSTEAGIDTRMDVHAALGRLSEEVRIVVVLHDLDGFGHREIADSVGISVSASKMRLHRGRMQLREWLLP